MCSFATFNIVATSTTSPPSPLTPPARVRQLAPLSPSAPLAPLIIQVPTNPLTLQPPPLPKNKDLNKQLATKSISQNHVNFTCKGNAVMKKKALVALIHILQCSLSVVIKDVPRVNPVSMHILINICRSSLLSHKTSVTELNAIVFLSCYRHHYTLGPPLIRTYPEILF